MKKFFIMLAISMMSMAANAFDFDGINLNNNVSSISKQITAKGYYYDEASKALVGNCRGTKILLSMNYKDVNTEGKLGQLIVDIPMTQQNAFEVITTAFNVIYHVVSTENGVTTYQADNDGTTVSVSAVKGGVRLTYNTPYYNK